MTAEKKVDPFILSRCAGCGMMVETVEYHPYAACVMYQHLGNADTVRANIAAVVDFGRNYDKHTHFRVRGKTRR